MSIMILLNRSLKTADDQFAYTKMVGNFCDILNWINEFKHNTTQNELSVNTKENQRKQKKCDS